MKTGIGFLIVFGLFWSGMTLLFDGFIVVPAMRQLAAQRFLATEGTVLSSEVTQHDDGDGTTHGVRITYAYSVGGREYTGHRFRYSKFSSSDSAWARQAVADHPTGSRTTVYYNPHSPEEAVLSPGLQGSDLFLALFMTPFNVVMLGFWWVGWIRLKRKWRRPVAGGVKLRTTLRRTRARMTEFSPLTSGVLTVALLSFLSIFVIGFGFGGFHPSLRAVTVTWGIVLTGGVAMWLWSWVNLLQGKYDLVVDEMRSSIRLPVTCGRKAQKSLSFAEVHSCHVETIEKRDNEGSVTHTYVPALRLAGADGPLEKLAEWHDRERAWEFAAWLSQKLGLPKPTQT